MEKDTIIFEYAGRIFSIDLSCVRAILNAGSFFPAGTPLSDIPDTLSIEKKRYSIFSFKKFFNAPDSVIGEDSRLIFSDNLFDDPVIIVDKIFEIKLYGSEDLESPLRFSVAKTIGPITEYEDRLILSEFSQNKSIEKRKKRRVRKVHNESVDS